MRGRDHAVWGEAELLEQHVALGAGAEVLDRHDLAGLADVLAPALLDAGLDADPRLDLRRQDLLPVGRRLRLEPLEARHRDHPGRACPRPPARSRAFSASATSEPVAMMITSARPAEASSRM